MSRATPCRSVAPGGDLAGRSHGAPAVICDDARAVIERVGTEQIDITTDDALHARLPRANPGRPLDGVELFEYFVEEGALRVIWIE